MGATTATPTTIRVVCNNTLSIAMGGATSAIKVPHSTNFDAQAVKKQLGIAVSQWDSFMYRMKTLAERKVKSHEAMNYFLKVICNTDQTSDLSVGLTNERALKKVQREVRCANRMLEGAMNRLSQRSIICRLNRCLTDRNF